jgi:hypothetical protein
MLKKFVNKFILPLDILMALLLYPAGYISYLYRKMGSSRLMLSTKVLRQIGVFPIINDYYEPLFETRHLRDGLHKKRNLPGLKLNVESQLKLLDKMIYSKELIELDLNSNPENIYDFKLKNGSFESGDAEFLYQFIRHFRPAKIIEIGSGNSTKLASKALNKNFLEHPLGGSIAQHICIEPYEMSWLDGMNDLSVIRMKVEDLDYDWREALNPGDLLFIDFSHIIRPQGDVLC